MNASDLMSSRSVVCSKHAFFADYVFSDNGAPMLNGARPVDMGMVLVVIQELGLSANSRVMSELLHASVPTCKNWVKKLKTECLCDIKWTTQIRVGKYLEVQSTGIFNMVLYEDFRAYFRIVIRQWKSKNGIA